MFEPQQQIQPNNPSVFVSGPGAPEPNWFNRLKQWAWPTGASLGRKIIVIVIPASVAILTVSLIILLITSSSEKTPPSKLPTTVTEESDGSQKPVTSNNSQSEAPKSDQPSSDKPAGNTNTGQSGAGGSTGQTGSGTSGGTSDGGSSGGATTTCPLPSYPRANCTGVPSDTSLATHSGDFSTSSAGQVITGMQITGDVEIRHNNVVIRNSEIHGHVKNLSTESFTIEDSTIGPTSGCFSDAAIGNNNYTARRIHLRGFAEGARVEFGDNVTVKDSFFKFCNPGADNHADAIQGYNGGNNIVFEHNTVDMRDIPKEADFVTAVIFWSDDSGNNVTFKDNLISGGSFSIRIHVGTGHTVSGNRLINNSWLYGPVSSSCSAINWSDNSIVEIDANYNITSTVSTLACAE